jgi:hypothetical protein
MPVTTTNLIAGPAVLYSGSFGATEPTDAQINTTPVASTWTDHGGTQDGVEMTIDRDFLEMEVDQLVDMPGRRLTKRDFQVKTNMAEPTLANWSVAMNGGTITASAAFQTYDPDDTVAATQPPYRAVMLDGYAPQTAAAATMRRRFIIRKALSIESIESSYKKDEMTLVPVTFAAHYVSASIKPFRIVDQLT